MNQEVTGKFIQQCRKEKGLTQMQLAEQLNITNRAVSKWETGKSMPDASIMMELCEILGITVNELFCGEHVKEEEYQTKAELNLVQLFDQKKNRVLLAVISIMASLLQASGLIVTLTFPSILHMNMTQNIVMRVFGVFIFICGLLITHIITRIQKELLA